MLHCMDAPAMQLHSSFLDNTQAASACSAMTWTWSGTVIFCSLTLTVDVKED